MKLILPKLAFLLIAGILTAFFVELPLFYVAASAAFLILFLILSFLNSKKCWKQNISFGIAAYTLFFLIGIIAATLQLPKNQKNHYLNHTSTTPVAVELKIREILKPDLYNQKFIAEVKSVNQTSCLGSVILYIPKDSLKAIQIDDKLFLISILEDIQAPLNPHQFSYKNYLANKGVHKEINFAKSVFLKTEAHDKSSLKGLASKARLKIIAELKENGFRDDELAIIEALLLGEKKDVSKEIYEQYADAGVIHILAVSGLHVGIILLLLNYLFSPLKYIRNGILIKLVVVIIFLWLFAFLAGLSASILRAVTMFTFVAIGMQINRKGHILNAIATSLIILLLINPYYLFEVGFQLSYTAVISIVLLQPILFKFYKTEKRIPKSAWSILSVTLAAQIGVLPLTLMYFHQFPGLFFISNLIILPFLGIILAFGIFVIVLALLNILPSFIGEGFETVIYYLNLFVRWISEQDNFIFKEIPFSGLQAITTYVLIVSIFLLLKKYNHRRLQLVLCSFIFIQIVLIFQKKENTNSELIVFHKSRNSAIGIKKNRSLNIYSDFDSIRETSFIQDYNLGEVIQRNDLRSISNFLIFEDKKILIIDSLGIYNIDSSPVDYILLKDSPKINLTRVIDELKPSQIIADGSNYPSFVNQWKQTCINEKIPFHSTREKGAFVVEQ